MTLIRHNVRTGSNQPVHYAHDSELIDTNGCYVSGRPGKFFTSEAYKCPQCAGYGKLVPIEKLDRTKYPQGSTVPEMYRVTGTRGVTIPTVTEPEPYEPISATATVAPVAAPVAAPAPVGDAASAITQLLATLVPDTAKIQADIATAADEVKGTLLAMVETRIADLLVPTTVQVSVNGADPTKVAGTVNPVFGDVLAWLASGCNVYLVGPAGCGKTTLARQVAEALGVPFYTTGQVLSEHQVTGFVDAGGSYHTTPFRQAFEHGGVWLADEMDAWSPEATLAANAALANGHATFPDSPEPIKAHESFHVIAAANTFGHGADREYVGRNELDASTLDRFVTVQMDYDRALESEIAGQYREWLDLVWKVRANATAHRVRIIVGTRKVIYGVRGLAAGMSMEKVATTILRGDLDDSTWAKVTA